MSGDSERRRGRAAQDQSRELRHDIGNSLFAIELAAESMAASDDGEDREQLRTTISGELAQVRVLLPQLGAQSASLRLVGDDFPRQRGTDPE